MKVGMVRGSMILGSVVLGTVAVAGLGLAVSAVPAVAAEAPAPRAREAGDRLGETIERAIRADGPFFNAEERAVIERKCGYAPGSFDGYEANITNGAFRCKDGKRVDDAEMRALLAAAEPRIERRVEAVMESEEVKTAIARVAEDAERQALAAIDHAKIAEQAAREAEVAVSKAMEEMRRSLEESRRKRTR
ncbi:MAG TPA: hypothetical protein VGB59_02760 [Allosphingosinicella sp.]|jgi:hypothetical protein